MLLRDLYSPAPWQPALNALEELIANLTGSSRAIVIAEKDVDLRPQSRNNRIFLLKVGEDSLAAGGRGGGLGERKVSAVLCYELKDGVWSRLFLADEVKLAEYEVPYYVSRIPLTMDDGSEAMGYGVVEPALVGELSSKSGIPSSA
jgi:hypothetical protein